jgi:hypothetical protein
MRVVLIVVGFVCVLLGSVWLLQGLNFLPGSFMTGSLFWAVTGFVAQVVGIALIALGVRGWRPAS